MKGKKMLLYAAPVILAGFLYLGESTGVGEVLAKTVKTVVQTRTAGKLIESYTTYSETVDEYSDEQFIYICISKSALSGGNRYDFNKYEITYTETEIYTEVPDDPSSGISTKVVPAADPEKEAAENAKRREEAAIKVQKEAEQKTEDFIKEISKVTEQAIQAAVKAGSVTGEGKGTGASTVQAPTAVIKTDYFTCFTQDMLEQLAANPGVNYEIHYRYQGKRYVLVIPAGTDYSKLQDSDGYYGFRYLDSIFGGYEEEMK